MKRRIHHHGGSLVELLVSLAVTAILLVIMVQALGGVQRAWNTTRSSASREGTAQQALAVLAQNITAATLNPRQRFDVPDNPAELITDSDLHFVCGPSAELLPKMPLACGDALFFQRPNSEGLLEGCGFYVQYGINSAGVPNALRNNLEAHYRFRLIMFRQPAQELAVLPSGPVGRAALYDWFNGQFTTVDKTLSHTAVAVDNVLALLVRTAPDDQRCYDTRRHQWEPFLSPEAARSRHRLPRSLELTAITTDETAWSRLSPRATVGAAREIEEFLRAHFKTSSVYSIDLEAMRHLADKLRLPIETATIVVPLWSP